MEWGIRRWRMAVVELGSVDVRQIARRLTAEGGHFDGLGVVGV
jgi:hypothetical protein